MRPRTVDEQWMNFIWPQIWSKSSNQIEGFFSWLMANCVICMFNSFFFYLVCRKMWAIIILRCRLKSKKCNKIIFPEQMFDLCKETGKCHPLYMYFITSVPLRRQTTANALPRANNLVYVIVIVACEWWRSYSSTSPELGWLHLFIEFLARLQIVASKLPYRIKYIIIIMLGFPGDTVNANAFRHLIIYVLKASVFSSFPLYKT